MGFLMFIFYLKKQAQKYVLSPWLYKMHHYFRVACVNGDVMVRAVVVAWRADSLLPSARGFSVMVGSYVAFLKA